jgi:ketosteroid isomerase-like protein
MDADREFLEWFETTWREADVALHNGDPGPRDGTWSTREPVTVFGAWMNATSADEARRVFRRIAESFSDVEEFRIELVAHGVSGDLAYTAHREHTTTMVDGERREYMLRTTQVYRREDGTWKVAHRHADMEAAVDGP